MIDLNSTFINISLTRWNNTFSPFVILVAISLLNVANKCTYFSLPVNVVSSVTMLIYIIHDNILFRTYTRPLIWHYIYEEVGHSHVVIFDMIYSILLFAGSVVVAIIWKITLEKTVYNLSDRIYSVMLGLFNRISDKI